MHCTFTANDIVMLPFDEEGVYCFAVVGRLIGLSACRSVCRPNGSIGIGLETVFLLKVIVTLTSDLKNQKLLGSSTCHVQAFCQVW